MGWGWGNTNYSSQTMGQLRVSINNFEEKLILARVDSDLFWPNSEIKFTCVIVLLKNCLSGTDWLQSEEIGH